jgi:hypothetical protein
LIICDILNSRNPLTKGFKALMRFSKEAVWKPFLEEAKLYLAGLTNDKGIPMYQTKRQTPFLGLICSAESTVAILPNSPLT